MKTFTVWLEDREARLIGSRDVILNFLKSELHITDEDVVLGMSTTDIDQSIISKLLARGIISSSSPDIIDRIKNGISVRELIDALASSTAPLAVPNAPPYNGA
jgi:hypothetical protein